LLTLDPARLVGIGPTCSPAGDLRSGSFRELGAAATTALASTIESKVSGERPRQEALGLSGFTRFGTTANTRAAASSSARRDAPELRLGSR